MSDLRIEDDEKSINKLPNHLLVNIGSKIHHCGHLRALALTSRRFHALFQEMLYKNELRGSVGSKALFWAAEHADFVLANKIIRMGGNLDATRSVQVQKSKQKVTALVLAMIEKHHAMATLLILARANVDKAPNTSMIPIFLAIKNDCFDVLKLMVSIGAANLAVTNEEGYGLLTAAAHSNRGDVVRYLLSISSRLGEIGREKSTAFHGAILHNNFAMFSRLLESPHISPKTPCRKGKTPLQFACEQNKMKFVRALLDDSRVPAMFEQQQRLLVDIRGT